MSSWTSTKKCAPPFQHQNDADLSQGDLGHTDLQEDLEFHSSSTPSYLPIPTSSHTNYDRLRHPAHARRPQNPTRLVLLPPRPHKLLRLIAQTLPLDPFLLRASLRRRHKRSPAPLHRRHIPARQLPRRPGRKSRSVRPRVDRDDGGGNSVSHGHD
jgi:hypothetical protein